MSLILLLIRYINTLLYLTCITIISLPSTVESTTVSLNVQFVVMTPPTRPEVTQRSKSSALVRWTVPDNNGLRITFFRIQYKDARSSGGRWLTMELDILPTIREYEVTGLEPGNSCGISLNY